LRVADALSSARRPSLPFARRVWRHEGVTSAVIFDCDGVLFDSFDANVAFYDAIRGELGLGPMDAEWRERAHYLAASAVLDEMFAADAALLARARAVTASIDYGPFYPLMTPAAELHQVLDALKPRHRLAMATNRSRTAAEVVRRFGLDRWIEVAASMLDVERPKPHPDVIEHVLERLGVRPERAVYVGDAVTDMEAAEAAGVGFVAVGEAPWAPRRVRELRELPALLDEMGHG
jgi:HAD superfamily hydrolase (TIGR01509 family)